MADLNTITITGRLTRDPELRSTAGGTQVATMRIAVDGRKRDDNGAWVNAPNFFNVVMFGKNAEIAVDTLTKGRRLGVSGRLGWREWESDNGKREAVEIIANDFAYLDAKPNGDGFPQGGGKAPVDDEDVPFAASRV